MKCNNFFCWDYNSKRPQNCNWFAHDGIRTTFVGDCKHRKAFNRFWRWLFIPHFLNDIVRARLKKIKKELEGK